jgi:iron(III) transport system substrate-binding protein
MHIDLEDAMRKFFALMVTLALVFGLNAGAFAADKQKLVVYTSMKESLIGKLRDAFVQKNPAIEFDYYSAGAGKLMAKLAAELESGSVVVDVTGRVKFPTSTS